MAESDRARVFGYSAEEWKSSVDKIRAEMAALDDAKERRAAPRTVAELRAEAERRSPGHSNCYSDFLAYKRRLKTATEAFCTCGGMGPEDHGVCPACKIYHAMGIGQEGGL